MSASTPGDLAVAFRSLAKRLTNAQNDHTPSGAVAGATSEIEAAVADAARVLGSSATPEGVAAAIDARHINDWTTEDLTALQRCADDAARAIRRVENLSQRD